MEPSVHDNGNDATTAQQPAPPDCYGSGLVKVYPYRHYNVYQWARVAPQTCFACQVEKRCLAQQRRMRRR
jgi:hypothetical protein